MPEHDGQRDGRAMHPHNLTTILPVGRCQVDAPIAGSTRALPSPARAAPASKSE
ncbi:hypothetical protein KSF_000680 [Reticulibacter mediterranei]|uniref:Uncharacterized protein n=1 Tax=Reticulibacter mediterranei TaxID=2778369 RepID=A0A8J3ICR4_9CHLR|nr:hypothetical protein [Reticulibacter mediterranei]GHO90020.1 hypothetical protein KSF_000680 [Reticulibacter mediterranei]